MASFNVSILFKTPPEIQNSKFKFQQALPNSRTTTNKTHSQHLVRGVVVVVVVVVIDVAIVEVDVGVA